MCDQCKHQSSAFQVTSTFTQFSCELVLSFGCLILCSELLTFWIQYSSNVLITFIFQTLMTYLMIRGWSDHMIVTMRWWTDSRFTWLQAISHHRLAKCQPAGTGSSSILINIVVPWFGEYFKIFFLCFVTFWDFLRKGSSIYIYTDSSLLNALNSEKLILKLSLYNVHEQICPNKDSNKCKVFFSHLEEEQAAG